MRIGDFPSITYSPQQIRQRGDDAVAEKAPQADFGQQIKDAVTHVNDLQKNADELVVQVASGNPEDAHKAVIAMEHALVALDFTIQIRNKVLEAYQEIMRTQL